MKPDIIRVIAPLPPKGNVAARHAGAVIHHLDGAGLDVRPSTTLGPAYCLDQLRFAPKAAYKADRERLLAALGNVVLYPEGLGFAQISQEVWWHRGLEKLRRLGLVWRLLWRAEKGILVFRPKRLKQLDHMSIVAVAIAAKVLRPKHVRLMRQLNSPEDIAATILGAPSARVLPEDAELTSLKLAVKHGAKGLVRLTPVWLRAAFNRLPETDPIFKDIKTLTEVVEHFGEAALPVLSKPNGYITAAPFADKPAKPVQGESITEFMLHIHQARRLSERFPLTTAADTRAYKDWFVRQLPDIYDHALFCETTEQITADFTPESLAKALHRIIANARFLGAETGVDAKLVAWLNTPISDGLTRLMFLLAVLAHAPVKDIQSLQRPWCARELAGWFTARAYAGYPMLAALAKLPVPDTPAEMLTTGDSAKDTGLGQNQRMSKTALAGLSPKGRMCLHHVNADAIPAQMLRTHMPGTYHIGFLLWEMDMLPKAHHLAGEVLNEVWAPSRFVERVYKKGYDIPVTWVGKGFDLPPAAPFDRARLGIEPDQPLFLLSFDLHSSVARKNPLAAVLAFQMAFEGHPEARLVIKTSEPPKNHWGDPEQQMSIIKKLMARDRRIILFQEHLPFTEYLGLIKTATALVSPHRSEGFGYVPAYAMVLGTPVIATDYAGTQDFCTPETALAIPWRKRLVRPGEPIYPLENAFWAEIDHDALAVAMQDILSNSIAARDRAQRGKALMQKEYSQAALQSRYKKRLTSLGLI